MDRRDFIKNTLTAGAAAVLGGSALAGTAGCQSTTASAGKGCA